MKKISMLLILIIFAFLLKAEVVDYSTGEYYNGEVQQRLEIKLPVDFNLDKANQQLLEARESGNIDKANILSQQINSYWKQNRVETFNPATHGTVDNTGNNNGSIMYRNNEENLNQSPTIPYWFDDVRIDPRDGIRGTSLVSLSNGELYCISIYTDSGFDALLIRRSTNNGYSWTTYWDITSSIYLFEPTIIAVHDTLIIHYILKNSSDQYYTWNITALPGNTYIPVYYGSSSGFIDADKLIDYKLCTDGAVYNSAYVYATWIEKWGTGSYDSTRVMFARSDDLNITSWEIGPEKIAKSFSGVNNIFFNKTRIAYGLGGNVWVVAYFHPDHYLTTYDESILGWCSSDFGASWNDLVHITPWNNGIDEYDPSIAGSHINTNWVCLATTSDTGDTHEGVTNNYSTDNGATWTEIIWNPNWDTYLSDIWVDDNSTAFFGVARRDDSHETVRYKRGDISDPTSWTSSFPMNDDDLNLSNSFGPSIAYNYATGDAIIAWTDYNSSIYSIWFDDESWSLDVEEETSENSNSDILNIIENPCKGNINLRYSIATSGNVQITLRDISGREVSEIINSYRNIGSYELNIEPIISSGVYYISINSADGLNTKQLIFVK